MESSFPVDAVQLEALLRREGCSAKDFAERNDIGAKNLERALKGDRLLLCTVNAIAEGFKKTKVTADLLLLGNYPPPRLPPMRITIKVEKADHREVDVTEYSAKLIGTILAERPELSASEILVTLVRSGCMEIELAVTERVAKAILELFAAGKLKALGVSTVDRTNLADAQQSPEPLELRILALLRANMEDQSLDVNSDTRIDEIDSVDFLGLVMALEEEFGRRIDASTLEAIHTVGDLVRTIANP
jgi:acyl carrier protein